MLVEAGEGAQSGEEKTQGWNEATALLNRRL